MGCVLSVCLRRLLTVKFSKCCCSISVYGRGRVTLTLLDISRGLLNFLSSGQFCENVSLEMQLLYNLGMLQLKSLAMFLWLIEDIRTVCDKEAVCLNNLMSSSTYLSGFRKTSGKISLLIFFGFDSCSSWILFLSSSFFRSISITNLKRYTVNSIYNAN